MNTQQQTTKTAQEIVSRIKEIEASDWLGTTRSDLIGYLPFDDAKPFIKECVTAEQWKDREVTPPLQAAHNYLEFAWEKANNCRGLSAGRSLDHLKAWLWLAGFGDLVSSEFENYECYGKRQLVIASVICGFDWKAHDDGRWSNSEDGSGLSKKRLTEAIDDAVEAAKQHMSNGKVAP